MNTRSRIYYEARLAFGMASLLPALLLPSFALCGWIIWTLQTRQPSSGEIAPVIEGGLCLSAGLLAAHLMSIERDEDFDEIRRTYAESSVRLPLIRISLALMLIALSALLSGLLFHVAIGDAIVWKVLISALPPAFYLLALSLLINNLTASYWWATGVIVGYWFVEFTTRGVYTDIIYIFRATLPGDPMDYHLNRWLLIALALLMLVANVAFSAWRRRRSSG